MAQASDPRRRVLDNGEGPGAQGAAATLRGLAGAPARERLRLRTLITLRWLAIGGQLGALVVVGVILKFQVALLPCLLLIVMSAALNGYLLVATPFQRLATHREAALQIGFDILQLATVLYFTGGILNPFSLLLIAPVTLAASTLPWRHVLSLGLLAIAAGLTLAVLYQPLPWRADQALDLPLLYRLGLSVAHGVGVAFTAAYAGYAASESGRMELALHMAEGVLAREQRLSALGGLAAAAAHELGTPLSSITLIAKEMARDAPAGPLREDAELLVEQAQRCRDILRSLSETPDTGDMVHARMTLPQLLADVIEPYVDMGVRVEWSVKGPLGAAGEQDPPEIRRMPEVIHALAAFVENAVDFAATEVRVVGRFDAEALSVEISDDGAGFAPEIFVKLGEPYVTSRPDAEGSRTGHHGMGLGFFIAKTLLERTAAEVDFKNERRGGAVVCVTWPRAAIEAPPQ